MFWLLFLYFGTIFLVKNENDAFEQAETDAKQHTEVPLEPLDQSQELRTGSEVLLEPINLPKRRSNEPFRAHFGWKIMKD